MNCPTAKVRRRSCRHAVSSWDVGGERFSNWMSRELRIRNQRWLGLILILSCMRHHPNDLSFVPLQFVFLFWFFFFSSHSGHFFKAAYFFFSFFFSLSHTSLVSCFHFFIWTTVVTNLHREKGIRQTNVMSWYDFVCMCSKCVCIYVCVPVVRLCSMYRPGLMEENTSSFFF